MPDEKKDAPVEFKPEGESAAGTSNPGAKSACRALAPALIILLVALALALVGGILGSLKEPNPWHTVFTGAGWLLALFAFTLIFFSHILKSLRETTGRLTTPEYGAVFGLVLALLFVYVVAKDVIDAFDEMFQDRLLAIQPVFGMLLVVPAKLVENGLKNVPWNWVLGGLFIALVVGVVVKSLLPRREE